LANLAIKPPFAIAEFAAKFAKTTCAFAECEESCAFSPVSLLHKLHNLHCKSKRGTYASLYD
jgi:hypothetical protein